MLIIFTLLHSQIITVCLRAICECEIKMKGWEGGIGGSIQGAVTDHRHLGQEKTFHEYSLIFSKCETELVRDFLSNKVFLLMLIPCFNFFL